MATLSLKNVKKRFGSTEVIHGVDVDINDGEFIVIVGPSGCGKTTLLNAIAGFHSFHAGGAAWSASGWKVRIDSRVSHQPR